MNPGYQHQRGGDIAISQPTYYIHDQGRILHVDVTDGPASSDPSSNSFAFSTRYVESTLLMLKKCIRLA